MTYAYEIPDRPDSFPNLRVAAQAPWRGLTALVQGQPYLVIDKDDTSYTLEGEDGTILKLERFLWDGDVSERDRLTAASRSADSPLKNTGTLYYDEEEGWLVIGDDGRRFNVEAAVDHLAAFNWFKSALKTAKLSGSFTHEMTGEEVTFHEVNHFSADKTVGAAEYWVVQGNDNSTYYISETGLVLDEVDNIVGRFEPYADPDPDRYEVQDGWYEDWDGPTAKTAGELYSSEDSYEIASYSEAPFIYDPKSDTLWVGPEDGYHSDLLNEFPEALEAYSEEGEHDEYDAEDFTYAAAGYIRKRNGELDTRFYNSAHSHHRDAIMNIVNQSGKFSKVAAQGFSFRGKTGGTTGIAEGVAVRPDRQSKEDVLRLVDSLPGHREDLQNQIDKFRDQPGGFFNNPQINRGGKVADIAQGPGGQGYTYAPGVILVAKWVVPDQNWLLYHDRCAGIIAEAGGLTSHGVVVARERNIPIIIDAAEAENIAPGDKVRMDGDTGIVDVNGGGGDIDRSAPGQEASMGVTRFVWSKGNRQTAPIPQDDPESGVLHQEMMMALDGEGQWDWEDFAFGTVYSDGHADLVGMPSDRDALEAWLTQELGVGEVREVGDMSMLASKEALNYPADPTQEQTVVELQRQIVAEEAKPAPDRALIQDLKWKLSELLSGRGMGLPALAAKVAAEGKYPAGTRVQLEHPKLRGQRGTILECNGTHKDLEEEQYTILLDSGEEVKDIMESHFKKIKSASFNAEAADSTGAYFLESMDMLDSRYSGDNEHGDYTVEGDDPVKCPKCNSHTVRAFGADQGEAQMKCLTCGNEFKRKVFKNPEAKVAEVGPGIDYGQCPECGSPLTKPNPNGPLVCPNCSWYEGKAANMQKGSPYPENSDKNAPDHSPPGQKLPKKVNSIYNACMRENKSGDGEPSDALKEKCMKVAWAQYKKMKGSSVDEDLTFEESEQILGSLKFAVAADTNGNELQPGQWYVMHSTQYKVPDVIRVLNIEDSRVEAAIEGDNKGHFPIVVTAEDIEKNGYSFEPYDEHEEPEMKEGGWKISRRAFSPAQQRSLIEENLNGRARNFDKLNLEGTHYPRQDEERDALSDFFLF